MEENPILSKPKKLVEEFFALAEEDSGKVVTELEEDLRFLERFADMIKPLSINLEGGKIRVAAVDGSRSPSPSIRIGVGASVATAGYIVAEGGKILHSDYRAKTLVSNSADLRVAVRIAMLNLEREMAVEALKWDPDFLIIDGSFFYPLSTAIYMRAPSYIRDAIQEAHGKTAKIIKSGRAVGVIKRSSLRAIEGELLLRGAIKPSEVRGLRDKFILEMLMSERALWKYSDFTAENPVLLSLFMKRFMTGARGADVLERVEEEMAKACRIQGIPDVALERAYVRAFKEPPPFEVEYPKGFNIERFAAEIIPWCNETTGLPFILDMLDYDIGVERGLIKAYVDEVHARALEKTLNLEALHSMFKPLNPEKDE